MNGTARAAFRNFINDLSVKELDDFIIELTELEEMFDDVDAYPAAFPHFRKLYERLTNVK